MARQRYTQVGGHTINATFPLVSSSTHRVGDMLIWDSTNGAQIAASAAANMAAISSNDNRFLGRANEPALDANGTVKSAVSVSLAQPLARFMLWLYHGTATSAVPTPLSQLGVAYEVRYQSADLGWAVALDATTNTFVVIADYVTGDLSTDGLPTWPEATTVGTNQYAPVWAAPILASCACVR